ncbi:MAG TPA: archaetidylserine decarboxylase [Acetobacteraceae bacterium]|nr:archaetidylserine decarboxylase [Acetobacteraceae bacterium]
MSGVRNMLARLGSQEDLNFLLTNRIPRRLATRFMGWFSRIENPLVRDISIRTWQLFDQLDLSDSRETEFRSLHDCFVRRLKDGARTIDADPNIVVSPCDAIVGAFGTVERGRAYQIKGAPYAMADLFGHADAGCACDGGVFVTLRLTSAMYHHFHAPHDVEVESVRHIAGDAWNVNSVALRRVQRLFCRNERAVITMRLAGSNQSLALIAVAAILVAGIRLCFLDPTLQLRGTGSRTIRCAAALRKGDEMGWFEHGSTIILFAPRGFRVCDSVQEGSRIRMGQALLRVPDPGGDG